MVREDIVGGLKLALAKGDTLKNAMMSFYQAGYKKEEIEEAARELMGYSEQPVQSSYEEQPKPMQQITQQPQPQQTPQKSQPIYIQKPIQENKELEFYTPKPTIQRPAQTVKPQEIYTTPQPTPIVQKTEQVKQEFYTPVQQPHPKYSQHLNQGSEEHKRSGTLMMIIILIIVLLLLLGALAGLILYKENIIEFINGFIGKYF